MKLHSLITCLVLSATNISSAQTAADPGQQTPKPGAGTARLLPPDRAARGTLGELTVEVGPLEQAVEKLTDAYKAVPEIFPGGKPTPMIIFGPGTREAMLDAPLLLANLADMRLVDAVALVAAEAGCIVDPIYSPPDNGGKKKEIIGYCIALASSRPSSTPSKTGSNIGGGESGAGDQPTGIGVTLGQKDGYSIVSQVIPGSPADRYHGFTPGDRILQVAEMGQPWVDVTGLPLEKVTKLIRGKPGSSVRLAIDPIASDAIQKRADMVVNGQHFFTFTRGISFVALEREKFDLTPPKALIPKVAEVNVPDLTNVSGIEINASMAPKGGKAGDPVKHPRPAATPDETERPIVHIYAIGSTLNGNEEEMKEDAFTNLVKEAFDLAGLAKGEPPQLYFHMKSGVLIAKTTARGHEIIEQIVNALRKSEEGPLPKPPKP